MDALSELIGEKPKEIYMNQFDWFCQTSSHSLFYVSVCSQSYQKFKKIKTSTPPFVTYLPLFFILY